jgi:hypothetical protein
MIRSHHRNTEVTDKQAIVSVLAANLWLVISCGRLSEEKSIYRFASCKAEEKNPHFLGNFD